VSAKILWSEDSVGIVFSSIAKSATNRMGQSLETQGEVALTSIAPEIVNVSCAAPDRTEVRSNANGTICFAHASRAKRRATLRNKAEIEEQHSRVSLRNISAEEGAVYEAAHGPPASWKARSVCCRNGQTNARKWTPNDDTAFKSRLSLLRRWADFCSARWIFLINASRQIDEVIHVEAGRFSHDSHRSF
jgi:hypothetical protein